MDENYKWINHLEAVDVALRIAIAGPSSIDGVVTGFGGCLSCNVAADNVLVSLTIAGLVFSLLLIWSRSKMTGPTLSVIINFYINISI